MRTMWVVEIKDYGHLLVGSRGWGGGKWEREVGVNAACTAVLTLITKGVLVPGSLL